MITIMLRCILCMHMYMYMYMCMYMYIAYQLVNVSAMQPQLQNFLNAANKINSMRCSNVQTKNKNK